MGHFYVFNFRKWRLWSIVVVIICMLAFFLWLQRALIFPFFYDDQPATVVKGGQQPYIALTFNISWGDEKVLDILDRLKTHNIKATFFVSGEWAERHPHILEKIDEGGNEIGMLGYRYKSYLKQEIEEVRRDLFQAKQEITKLDYDEVKWLRPPSGHFNEEMKELAERLGMTLVHWTINPNDWENPGTETIVKDFMKDLSKGDIVLLHASDAAKQTAGALDEIIPLIKDKNLSFVTVSELLSQVETKSNIVN